MPNVNLPHKPLDLSFLKHLDPKLIKIPRLPKDLCNHVILHYLPLTMQQQTQSNWCWVTVATSIGLYYQTGNWTQCGVINGCLNISGVNCCNTPSSAQCNVPGSTAQALQFTKSLNYMVSQPTTQNDVESQINQGRPLGVSVAWTGGGAHAMAISGYKYCAIAPSAASIVIQDPIFGETIMLYKDFPAKYQSGGTWARSHFTKYNP